MDVTVNPPKEYEDAVNKFHTTRKAFFFLKGKLIFNENREDTRDHYHWVNEDFGVSLEEYNHSPRGYMLPGRIQFFIGDCFEPIDTSTIDIVSFGQILQRYKDTMSMPIVEVCNGVEIGELGKVWKPLHTIASINVSGIIVYNH